MSIDKELLKSRNAIVEIINVCNEQLTDAMSKGDQETVASQTYMIAEYEQMLEEFDKYHDFNLALYDVSKD